ncbi:MAG: M48 family metalloprotease, partial [Crenarchaeota archaeon]|nr:M48 family metalloprotease [Thermoproteota archaeon]
RAVLVEGPPNAFAYGNFLAGRYVAVSRSLYQMLPEDELLAVIGHELGHHRHRDVVLMLLLGMVPSILYYMGVTLIRIGLWGGWSSDREQRSSPVYLAAVGAAAVALSFLLQVAVLAFSRLREYYADAHGAAVAGARAMQRALARLHLYYTGTPHAREELERHSSLKALFIYALLEAAAEPFYSPWRGGGAWGDIDRVVETLKRMEADPLQELLSSHPPIPKRLRFLDRLARGEERVSP